MANGRFVDGNTRGWRSARRFRLWSRALNVVRRRDDRRSRPSTRDSLSRVHVTAVRLLVLICLTFVSSWTSASDAGPGPIGSYSPSLFSNGLTVLQTGEIAAPQVDGDYSADDHSAKAGRSSPWRCRLIVPPSLQRVVTAGWVHSATFRAQCRRLAEAQAIVILSAFTLPTSRPAKRPDQRLFRWERAGSRRCSAQCEDPRVGCARTGARARTSRRGESRDAGGPQPLADVPFRNGDAVARR